MNKHEQGMMYSKKKEGQILEGVKILDFGWALVGSLTTKYLADYGAQVVRIESTTHIDSRRASRVPSISVPNSPDASPIFAQLNTSKYSMLLNLKHPQSREILAKLIRWADVVNANFAPGVMDRLGLGYDHIKRLNPDIIVAEGSTFGQTGTLARLRGHDGIGAASSGYLDLTGWPDRAPILPNAPYGDVILPFFIAMAIIAALRYRLKTGEGQHIDVSMLEVCVHQITPALLDWQSNKHLQTRNGNRIEYASPHGVFPCLGDDRWCAIAVFTDEEWNAFCHVIGDISWTREPRFATLKSRKENEDELEKLVGEWTIKHSAEEIMQMMQGQGIPAGVVQNAQDISDNDPQFREREFFIPIKHPIIGVFKHSPPPFKLTKSLPGVKTSPCLGEHTEYVCTQLLGMSDVEFTEYLQRGVFE